MAAAVVATLTIGLGMFAVVFTVIQKILIDMMGGSTRRSS